MAMRNPPHPGKLIREHMGETVTTTRLARHLGMPRGTLSSLIHGKGRISPLLSLKLDETFSKSDGFFSRIQQGYDLAQARRVKRKKIKQLVISDYEEAA